MKASAKPRRRALTISCPRNTNTRTAWSAVGDDLLQELNARVYVADLPPKYNLHIIANEGCEEGHIIKEMLANPLGTPVESSLDKTLYRCALCLLRVAASERLAMNLYAPGVLPILQRGNKDVLWSRETPYFSLELHIHLQMLSSPLRVLTAEEADIVYAPPCRKPFITVAKVKCTSSCPASSGRRSRKSKVYEVHLHPCRYVPFYGTQLWADLASGKQIGSIHRSTCQREWSWADQDELIGQFWADAPALLPLLGSKPHWMGLSEIEWMMHRGCGEVWGIPLMCNPLAEQVTFTTPEALTEQHPTAHWRTHFYGRAPAHNNSLAVPYLGHITA